MKRLSLAGFVLLAACGVSKPAGRDLPEGHVVLGTFTADVDLEAGTMVIRNEPRVAEAKPGDAGSARLVNIDASVTVANSGAAWVNQATPACTSGSSPTTWGAAVTVRNDLPGRYVGGVYAEITNPPPAMTGRESCSNSPVPPGLSGSVGLWSYGTIAPGATTSATNWVFKYTTAASRFSFSGRVIGVRVGPGDVNGGSQRAVDDTFYTDLVDNGTSVVVAGGTSGIDFVDATTGLYQQSVATTGRVTALGVAPARIWWAELPTTTTDFVVGWMSVDGTGKGTATVTTGDFGATGWVSNILPDPVSPSTKAWVVYQNRSNTTYVQSYTVGAGAGKKASAAGLGYSAAVGPDGRLYLGRFSGEAVAPYDLTTDPASAVGSGWYTGSDCSGPNRMSLGLDGKLYFVGDISARACTIATDGTITQVGSVSGPRGITATAAGEVWAATSTGVQRVEAGATSYAVAIPGGSAVAVRIANGYLWTTASGKLWQVEIQ
ncbi:MAG: hypothetical protein WB493_05440 [Anaeromyxobacteraceae bacterium]